MPRLVEVNEAGTKAIPFSRSSAWVKSCDSRARIFQVLESVSKSTSIVQQVQLVANTGMRNCSARSGHPLSPGHYETV